MPDIAFLFGHGNGLFVKTRIFQRNTYGGCNRLQKVLIICIKLTVDFIEHLDDANDLSL